MEGPRVIADASRLADSFSSLPPTEVNPAIIVVSGLPGTGKSYFSRRLAERLPYLILESDALRKKLFPAPAYSAEESAYLFRTIHQLLEGLLKKGIPVILDATNLSERNREYLYSIAEHSNARLVLVEVKAPPELVKKRLKIRMKAINSADNSDADWAIYEKMRPAAEKINRRHYTVDTSRDITPVIDKIVREVNR
jgi:predicted kinase